MSTITELLNNRITKWVLRTSALCLFIRFVPDSFLQPKTKPAIELIYGRSFVRIIFNIENYDSYQPPTSGSLFVEIEHFRAFVNILNKIKGVL